MSDPNLPQYYPTVAALAEEERRLDAAAMRVKARLIRTRDLIARLSDGRTDADAPYRRADALRAYEAAAVLSPAELETLRRVEEDLARLPGDRWPRWRVVAQALRRVSGA